MQKKKKRLYQKCKCKRAGKKKKKKEGREYSTHIKAIKDKNTCKHYSVLCCKCTKETFLRPRVLLFLEEFIIDFDLKKLIVVNWTLYH